MAINNVGDVRTFTINGTRTDDLTYCWFWWDGSVDATTVPTATKVLNMGGDPRYSGTLPVQVEVVDALGKSGMYQTVITVNNPPQIVPGLASATPNGKIVSFDTVVHAVVYDLEDGEMTFAWSTKDIALGQGSSSYYGQVDAYWNGTLVGKASGTLATFPYTVVGSSELSLTITDEDGGETIVDFPVYGFQRSDTYFAPTAGPESQIGDASSEPIVTAGENAQFTVYSAAAAGRTVFVWGFWGTNGWTFPSSSNGDTALLPDGTVRNLVLKATTGELPGNKLAEVTAIDLDHNTFAIVTIPVIVVNNDPPQAISYEITPTVPTAGDDIRFSASYTDPNLDIVTTKWTFTSPSLTLWGRTVWVDTTGMNTGATVEGKFEVFDRLGAVDEISFSIILA
jgi:hypothetical protein